MIIQLVVSGIKRLKIKGDNMKKYFILIMITFICFLRTSCIFAEGLSDVEIKTIRVTESIYMLQGMGGNIGVLIGDDGVLIVDDQFAPLSEKILDAINKIGGDKPEFVLNTHWHGDHTGGNPEFGRFAHIIAHENVRERLSSRQESKFFDRVTEAHSEGALPVITFQGALTIHFNGIDVCLVHFPRGHTDGDSIVFFEGAGVVHMGDHFFSGTFPFIDLESGGDVKGYVKNVGEVLSVLNKDVKIIPGHGPLSGVTELSAFYRMLLETTNVIGAAIKDGKTADDIKAEGLLNKWEKWGRGFITVDKWIDIVYQSLS